MTLEHRSITRSARLILAVVIATCGLAATGAHAARAYETVRPCANGEPDAIWTSATTSPGVVAPGDCSTNLTSTLSIFANANVPTNSSATFSTTAPAGFTIIGTDVVSRIPAPATPDWTANYVWDGHEVSASSNGECPLSGCPTMPNRPGYLSTKSLAFGILCTDANGSCPDGISGYSENGTLYVDEDSAPTLGPSAGSLSAVRRWVRGVWPLKISGDSPSGLCSISASFGGLGLPGTSSAQDQGQWRQCGDTSLDDTVNTARFPNGVLPLSVAATSAAGNSASFRRSVYIDNTLPTVALSGPTDFANSGAPTSVPVVATAGASGVAEIDCNVDGRSRRTRVTPHRTASIAIPVAGLGAHTITCQSRNQASDPRGTHGASPIVSRTITLRSPSAASIHFLSRADRLRCRLEWRRVRVPAGWHHIRWHGHRIKARLPPHTVRKRVRVCHERLVTRHITVTRTVRRHGRRVHIRVRRTIRVPVKPHTVGHTVRHVAYGHHTTVSGWLGTTSGVALGGQPITVVSVPDDGALVFHPVGHAVTRADGSWTAQIPRGPGRLMHAVYGGTSSDEPAISDAVKTVVHAKVTLAPISPHRVPWGSRITLAGGLPGGYVPRGGVNIRLRYGIGSERLTYGVHEHVGTHRSKRFKTDFTFGAGQPRAHRRFFFQLCTLPSANYPYAPGCSARQTVDVGGTTPHHRTRRHRHRR